MVAFTKLFTFTTPNAPSDSIIYVLQDEDGWYWLKKLVEIEGLATPFLSLEHVEMHLGIPLILIDEVDRKDWETYFEKK